MVNLARQQFLSARAEVEKNYQPMMVDCMINHERHDARFNAATIVLLPIVPASCSI